jgi:hypothetical protein
MCNALRNILQEKLDAGKIDESILREIIPIPNDQTNQELDDAV